MKFLKQLFDFYIESSTHVALSVYSLIKITAVYLGVPNIEEFNYFIFYGTIVGYNFVKNAERLKLRNNNLPKRLKIHVIFSLLSFFAMVFYGFQLRLQTVFLCIPFALLTVFYAIPFFNRNKNTLRNIPSIKILIIGFVWAGVTVLLPVLNAKVSMNFKIVLLLIQRFLFVIVLTLPFDIRDFRFDKKQLQTIPQLIGVERAKKIGFFLLAIVIFMEFFITPSTVVKYIFLIIFMSLLIFLQRASIHQKKYYASFWGEAIPVFWAILLVIYTHLV